GDGGYITSSGATALTVSRADQSISFGALSNTNYGDADFALSATSSSNLTVTFAAAGNCSVAGSTVHMSGAGSCTITASQAGDGNYNAAVEVPQQFSIAQLDQTITFTQLAANIVGEPDVAAAAPC